MPGMNVDLSHKSIRELNFDTATSTPEELLVAARVARLTASHNCIDRISGLGSLFHKLTHLDLSYNNLGGNGGTRNIGESVSGNDHYTPWLTALPPTLRVLNLSYNRISGFSLDIVSGDKPACTASAYAAVEASVTELRRTCTVTLALFFSRCRFPNLHELDLAHNALCQNVEESDVVEEMWQHAVERNTASAVDVGERAAWVDCTTTTIAVLRLDGNTQLSSLNGLLCGMESLRSLFASNTGIEDLAGVSAAAASCPQLQHIDLRASPVTEAFLNAPRTTVATFTELIVLPFLMETLNVPEGEEEQQDLEKRRATIQEALHNLLHHHLDEIETLIKHRQNKAKCGGRELPLLLYVSLLQQVVPQIVQMDDDIDVDVARRLFLEAVRDVLQKFIENSREAKNEIQRCRLIARRLSPPEVASPAANGGTQRKHLMVSPLLPAEKSYCSRPSNAPAAVYRSGGTGSVPLGQFKRCPSSPAPQPQSMCLSDTEGHLSLAPAKDRPACSSGPRSKSAHGGGALAAAAATAVATTSADLRPVVLVRSNASVDLGIDDPDNEVDNVSSIVDGGNKAKADGADSDAQCTFAPGLTDASACSNYRGPSANVGTPLSSREKMIPQPSKSRSVPSSIISPESPVATVGDSCILSRVKEVDCSSSCDESKASSVYQRAVAALTPVLNQRLHASGLSDSRASANDRSRNSTSVSEDRYSNSNQQNNYTSTTSSVTTHTTGSSSARDTLLQQVRMLEASLLSSQERQRGLHSVVSQLKHQLKQDRQLIIDQRREVMRLRHERDTLFGDVKSTKFRLRKRQKEIFYGATALQRREAQEQRRVIIQHLSHEEKSLKKQERRLRRVLTSAIGGAVGRQTRELDAFGTGEQFWLGRASKFSRKTRSDILRECAVRERMEALKKAKPLAYDHRKFRPNEHSFGSEVVVWRIRPSRIALTTRVAGNCVERAEVANHNHVGSLAVPQSSAMGSGKLKSLYQQGFTPYFDDGSSVECDDSSGCSDTEKVHTDTVNGMLQQLSLHQLFDRAVEVQRRQHLVKQYMQDMEVELNTTEASLGENGVPRSAEGRVEVEDLSDELSHEGIATPSPEAFNTVASHPARVELPLSYDENDCNDGDSSANGPWEQRAFDPAIHSASATTNDVNEEVSTAYVLSPSSGKNVASAGQETISRCPRALIGGMDHHEPGHSPSSGSPPIPENHLASRHLSVSARNIYAEIVRQQSLQGELTNVV
uniref:Leucine-rich repeat protein (LRRP) n=1 Tax=Trypanosoma vivax (strain Y486) TaxID=1055687 RepID=G0U4I0_TRYVY|nr:conserved hypothetical protein, fragment [Trypanosoma vivax Y486]